MDLNELLRNMLPDHDPDANWNMLRRWKISQYLHDCVVQELVTKEEEETFIKMIYGTEEDRELAAEILKEKLGI